MNLAMISNPTVTLQSSAQPAKAAALDAAHEDPKLRKAFDQFVGETFYGQMLSAMRKTVDKPAYFHGGRAEEVFRGQLDQVLATEMAESDAHGLTSAMFELFTMQRAA